MGAACCRPTAADEDDASIEKQKRVTAGEKKEKKKQAAAAVAAAAAGNGVSRRRGEFFFFFLKRFSFRSPVFSSASSRNRKGLHFRDAELILKAYMWREKGDTTKKSKKTRGPESEENIDGDFFFLSSQRSLALSLSE